MTHRLSTSTTPLTGSAAEAAGAPQPSGAGATSTPGGAADTRGERAPSRTLTADVLVVGAGILGLHAARLLARQNARVVLCDPVDPRTDLTAGTATPLGALMPHMPDKWNAKKQFQFDALVSLEDLAGALHSDTGHDPGYARCGRVMPIRTEHFKGLAEQRCQESAHNWQSDQVVKTPDALRMSLEPPGTGAAWLDPDVAPHGVFKDPLAARIDARAYRRALAVQCADLPMCAALFNHGLVGLDHTARRAQIAATDGMGTVQVDYHIVLMAAGFRGFELLERHFALELGFGVHGEAAVFQLAPDAANDLEEAPIIYDDGTYVVAHGGGRVAVGSTSARHFTEANGVAPEMPAFIARAQALCPPLRNAALIERWAGVRPKCVAREPVAGLWPETPGLAVLTGGFKISLGVAHYLAQAAVAGMVGDLNDPALAALPPTWHPLHHLPGHQLPGHQLPAQNA